jgi:hypothetical protein
VRAWIFPSFFCYGGTKYTYTTFGPFKNVFTYCAKKFMVEESNLFNNNVYVWFIFLFKCYLF